jgi:photosystem II stability/assembly factor-like uncharacterized protein
VAVLHNQYCAARIFILIFGFLVVYQFTARAQQYGWTVLATPNPGYQMHAVEFKDTLHGWCEAGGLIYRTTDGGHTWTAPVTQSFGVGAISMYDTLNGWAVGYHGPIPRESAILHTTDGGKNWMDQIYIQDREYYDVSALSKQRAIVTGSTSNFGRDTGAIVLTTNGGSLWTENTHADTIDSFGKIEFIDSLHGWMEGTYINTQDGSGHPGFFRTTKGENSFDLVKQYTNSFSFVDTSNGFAYTGYDNNGLFVSRTRDGGITWQPMYLPYISVYTDEFTPQVVSFVDTLNGWMFCETTYHGALSVIIIQTTDGGVTWTKESVGLASSFGDAQMIDLHHGWAATLDGQVLGYGLLTGVVDHPTGLPTGFVLKQNYPNPFNNSTLIEYEVPRQSDIHITIYDGIGKLISTLIDEIQSVGTYRVEFDATGLSSGIYYYRIEARQISTSRDRQATFYRNTKPFILIK